MACRVGTLLVSFGLGSGINSPPITYTHKGRQYVTVLSGIGGVLNRTMKVADRVPNDDVAGHVPTHGGGLAGGTYADNGAPKPIPAGSAWRRLASGLWLICRIPRTEAAVIRHFPERIALWAVCA
jgi:hypothetical protein